MKPSSDPCELAIAGEPPHSQRTTHVTASRSASLDTTSSWAAPSATFRSQSTHAFTLRAEQSPADPDTSVGSSCRTDTIIAWRSCNGTAPTLFKPMFSEVDHEPIFDATMCARMLYGGYS
jgi:hypothetical protein